MPIIRNDSNNLIDILYGVTETVQSFWINDTGTRVSARGKLCSVLMFQNLGVSVMDEGDRYLQRLT